jgi:succinoglycan biosynthesis protein ExoM
VVDWLLDGTTHLFQAAAFAMTKAAAFQIDIGICTYRRPALRKTLLAVAALVMPEGARIRVIVADNDTTPSAKPLVDDLRSMIPHDLLYVFCPASNISLARNACVDHATGDYLAFVDDDEYPAANWLVELIAAITRAQADVVLGPALSIYSGQEPSWMRSGDFHSTLPVWVKGQIRTGYTCNVLLRLASPYVKDRRFNLALGRSGGEDTEFFSGVYLAGGQIAFTAKAVVFDPVPDNRATLTWLARRKFRAGQTHGRLLRQRSLTNFPMREFTLALAKSGFCTLACVMMILSPVPRYRYALRAIMHLGVASALTGVREIEQYGDAHSPGGKPHGA